MSLRDEHVYRRPSNDWIYNQAMTLSSSKSANAVGALAWNISIAFTRWQAEQDQTPNPETKEREA